MINFKPFNDKILVKVLPEKEVTKSNLVIPDVAKERPIEAEVLAVSTGWFENGIYRTSVVRAGDHIYFGKYSGTEIELDGEKYLILKEDDILGKETNGTAS